MATPPRRRAWPWNLLPRAGAGNGRPWACSVAAGRRPWGGGRLCSFTNGKAAPLGRPAPQGARPPRGDGNRKDATVWGFNIPNGKNTRKLYSIFPVKVIILHRTKKSKKHAGSERRPASGAAEAGDAVQLLSGVLFSVCFRGLASVRPLSSH